MRCHGWHCTERASCVLGVLPTLAITHTVPVQQTGPMCCSTSSVAMLPNCEGGEGRMVMMSTVDDAHLIHMMKSWQQQGGCEETLPVVCTQLSDVDGSSGRQAACISMHATCLW